MKRVILLNIILSMISINVAYAQCNNRLVEMAAAQSGSNTIYLREFKAKFNEGTIENPTPTTKYSLLLNSGIMYRFTLANSKESQAEAILQLYYKDQLLGSTFDIVNIIDNKQFNYQCTKTGTYQILMSMKDGKPGCAAAVLSMILNDSTNLKEQEITVIEKTKNNILYYGIDNEINIASNIHSDGIVEASISQGIISGAYGKYTLRFKEEGIAWLRVMVKSKDGKILEKDSIEINVIPLPAPTVSFINQEGGLISKNDLYIYSRLQVHSPFDPRSMLFEIIEFSISKSKNDIQSVTSYSNEITANQLEFIQNLNPGEVFYINKILIRGPGNKIYSLGPLGFIVD